MRNFKEGESSFWITLDPGMEQEYLKDRVAGWEYLGFPGHWFPFPTGHTAGQDRDEAPFWLNPTTQIPLEDIHSESIYTNGTAWVFRLKESSSLMTKRDDTPAWGHNADDVLQHNGWLYSATRPRPNLNPHEISHVYVRPPHNDHRLGKAKSALEFLQYMLVKEGFFQFTTESREDLRSELDRCKNSLEFNETTVAKLEHRLKTAVDKKEHDSQIHALKSQVASGVENNNSLQEVVGTMRLQASTLRAELTEAKGVNLENILLIESMQAELESLTRSLDETEVKLAAALSDDLKDEEEIKELLHSKRVLSSELEIVKASMTSAERNMTAQAAQEEVLTGDLAKVRDELERKTEQLNSTHQENQVLATRLTHAASRLNKLNSMSFFQKLAWIFKS